MTSFYPGDQMTVTSLGRQLSQEDLSVQCPAATNCQMTLPQHQASPSLMLLTTGQMGEAITDDQGS